MSVQSEALYYRQGPPPTVTGDQILGWIKQIKTTGIVDPKKKITLKIDYGKRIDKRHKTDKQLKVISPSWWRRLFSFRRSYATVSKFINHTHDLEFEAESFDELIDRFEGGSRSIQRAHIMFWGLDQDLERRITAQKSDENRRTFTPFHCSLDVGPVVLSSLSWDTCYSVGYISFEIFGDGHFWPESFGQWVDRCAREPAIEMACKACRDIWPSEPGTPSPELLSVRTNEEHFWPYDDPSGPNDWAWGQAEDG